MLDVYQLDPDNIDIDEWIVEMREIGPAVYEPGERERLDALMAEADRRAKASSS